jgi:hypothetical protein
MTFLYVKAYFATFDFVRYHFLMFAPSDNVTSKRAFFCARDTLAFLFAGRYFKRDFNFRRFRPFSRPRQSDAVSRNGLVAGYILPQFPSAT